MKKRFIIGFIILIFSMILQGLSLFTNAGEFDVPTPNIPQTKAPETSQAPNLATVERVVDGDTLVVVINGTSKKIRLIGVNTPETVDPRRKVECFGKEASAFTKTLLENKLVRLETDTSQGDKDKYGRLLRYVYQGDIFVNEKIISEGYGYEYTYRLPYRYQARFKTAQKNARDSQKGLWAPGVCANFQ